MLAVRGGDSDRAHAGVPAMSRTVLGGNAAVSRTDKYVAQMLERGGAHDLGRLGWIIVALAAAAAYMREHAGTVAAVAQIGISLVRHRCHGGQPWQPGTRYAFMGRLAESCAGPAAAAQGVSAASAAHYSHCSVARFILCSPHVICVLCVCTT
jgi:hypothetical protein